MDCPILVRGITYVFTLIVGAKGEGFKWLVRLPAFIVLIFYFGFDILPTLATVETGELEGNINYVAHVTGFLGGVLIFLFVRKDLLTRYWSGRRL